MDNDANSFAYSDLKRQVEIQRRGHVIYNIFHLALWETPFHLRTRFMLRLNATDALTSICLGMTAQEPEFYLSIKLLDT